MQRLDLLTFPLAGVRLIEASAGTGKTYTIANLYLRLLLERRLEIDQVLVVTFTNAATEELRERIRRRLRDALALLESGGAGEDGDLGSLVLRADADGPQRLRDAITRMDEAAIFTIHGFCQRTLRENAFESGALFDAELLAEVHELRRAVLADFWRRRFYGAGVEEAAWAAGQWPEGPGALLAELRELLNRHEVGLLPPADPALAAAARQRWRAAVDALAARWPESRAEVAAILRDSPALNRNSYRKATCEAALAALDGFVAEPRYAPPFKLELFTTAKLTAATKKGNAAPEHPFFPLCDALHAASEPLPRLLRAALLGEAHQALLAGLEERKERLRALSYDDLLTRLDRALADEGGAALAERVRTRYPVALIDEFQDTDPLQYRIFGGLYRGHPACGLFMIGDPKQAIYGFRGADIFTYMQARHDTDPATDHFTLLTNWRSSRALIGAVNHLFGRASAPFIYDQDIPFHPVVAAGDADREPLRIDGAAPAPLAAWLFHRQGEDKPLPKSAAEPWCAAVCAAEVVRLLRLAAEGRATLGDRECRPRALRAGDIAVLVRKASEAQAVRAALTAVGLPSVFISRDSVFATVEAEELARVLTAVAEPGSERALRAALATTLLGLDARAIDDLARDEAAWEGWLERFQGWNELWRARGFLAMFQRLLHDTGASRRLLALRDGDRRLTNLLQLGELAQLAADERPGMDHLLRWLADHRAEPDGEREEQQLRLESDENLIQIVTIHKSKGLEYPVVFLPFLWSGPTGSQPPRTLLFHDPDDRRLYADLGSDAHDAHRLLAERERLAEDLRLLYVALTRAKYRCCFAWGAANGAVNSALGYLLHQGTDEDGAPVCAMADLDDTAIRRDLTALEGLELLAPPAADGTWWEAAPETVVPAARAFARRIDSDWRITSYSGLVAGHEAPAEFPDHDALAGSGADAAPAAARRDVFGFERGARAGVFLHGLFERLDFPTAEANALRPEVERQLQRNGLSGEWAEVVARWVCEVIDTPLDETGLCLRHLELADRRDELAFYYPLARLTPEQLGPFAVWPADGRTLTFSPVQGMMKGYIDLVFRHDGRFYLADYKSNHLGDTPDHYTRERLDAAMAEHRYDLQYQIYTVALHRYLRRRLADYDYDRHFGGVFYLFLRGMRPTSDPRCGVWFDRPQREVVEELDRLFGGGVG